VLGSSRSLSLSFVMHAVRIRLQTALQSCVVASATGADYATQVPYADSVLASAPPWHLPGRPLSLSSSKMQSALPRSISPTGTLCIPPYSYTSRLPSGTCKSREAQSRHGAPHKYKVTLGAQAHSTESLFHALRACQPSTLRILSPPVLQRSQKFI